MRFRINSTGAEVIADQAFMDTAHSGDYTPLAGATASLSTFLTPLDFRKRFTSAEKQAIYGAASTDPLVRCYLDDVGAADHVDLSDSYTAAGVQYLETAGLLSAGRAAQILTP